MSWWMGVLPVDELVIQSHRGPYRVRFGPPFCGLESGLREQEHLIIDAKVAQLYSNLLGGALSGHSVLQIEATETNKSLEKLPGYIRYLLDRGIRRDHVLIAVGGGIIQDITAFIAATLLRGVSWRFYPTTLLAQADSCIGSKSSINVGPYKNQIGTFTPPNEIWISTEVLDTLDETEIRSGLGEMIKVHIISGLQDARVIAADYPKIARNKQVMAHYIRRALEIKKTKIEVDEFDRNERLVMNYGHSFGHALESATHYAIPHGIAVTIGMDMANYISFRLGLLRQEMFDEIGSLLVVNYAGFDGTPVPEARFFAALGRDKKNTDQALSLILLKGPGEVFRERLADDERFRGLCRDYFRKWHGTTDEEQPAARSY